MNDDDVEVGSDTTPICNQQDFDYVTLHDATIQYYYHHYSFLVSVSCTDSCPSHISSRLLQVIKSLHQYIFDLSLSR